VDFVDKKYSFGDLIKRRQKRNFLASERIDVDKKRPILGFGIGFWLLSTQKAVLSTK